MYAHEKRQQQEQWERERASSAQDELTLRRLYEEEKAGALQTYLHSVEGRQKYEQAYPALLALYKVTEPRRFQQAAKEAALDRIERLDFRFPEYAVWALTRRSGIAACAA